MDSETKSMLAELKLDFLSETFIKEAIDFETLKNLSSLDMKELIPSLGHRSRVSNYVKNIVQSTITLAANDPRFEVLEINSQEEMLPNYQICTANDSYGLLPGPSNSSSAQLDASSEPARKKIVLASSCDSALTVKPTDVKFNTARKKSSSLTGFRNNKSLQEFLNNNRKGQLLLQSYSMSGKLIPSMRTDLVHLIVDEVMDVNKRLTSNIADEISDEIVQLFPTECKGAYYYPPKPSKKNSGGKLIDRYRNILNKYKQPKISSANINIVTNPRVLEADISDDILSKIAWLKSSTEPVTTIQQYWRETAQVRFQDRVKSGPVSEFVVKWPSLKDKRGYFLVNS